MGDTELTIVLQHPKEFRIRLQKDDRGLGIEFTHAPKGNDLLITNVLGEGAIKEWNNTHENATVQSLDRIVEVNGTRGGWTKLISLIQEHQDLNLVISPGPIYMKASTAATVEST